jgi:nucleoside-diphosphate-sugar epimerase
MFDHNRPAICITGATGFLGSHLMNALLMKGYHVIALGRATKDESLSTRISKLLGWFGNLSQPGILKTIEIDYSKPRFGLTSQIYSSLCSETNQIIHCASDTNFSERKRDRVFKFNVHQLSEILEFASSANVHLFHYISTAYAVGINGTVCKEELSTAKEFTNIYEESKCRAEHVVNDYCVKNLIPFTIIRPTIVYGDSQTGRSLKFNALYHPIRSVMIIRDIYLNDILNHGGKKSFAQGVHLQENGNLFLPIKIYLPKKGGINLIPVDYFVNATLKIIANPISGRIYHLINRKQAIFEEIAAYNEVLMKIKGIEIHYKEPGNNSARNPAEALFDRFIAPYHPYFSDTRIFDNNNTEQATENIMPPEFDYHIFKKCMEYAMKVDWGERIFNEI